jgi:hypothetical protein
MFTAVIITAIMLAAMTVTVVIIARTCVTAVKGQAAKKYEKRAVTAGQKVQGVLLLCIFQGRQNHGQYDIITGKRHTLHTFTVIGAERKHLFGIRSISRHKEGSSGSDAPVLIFAGGLHQAGAPVPIL